MTMDIRLVRIDDRLIHGQVVTTWSKVTGIERILVVDDEVAKDKMRKFLLSQAVPPGIKANVVTIKKMIEVYHHLLFNGVKVMLLFTNPQDVAALVRAGIRITTVNIGGMRYTEGKKMINNFVSVNQQDIDSFRYLDSQNIKLDIRKVPADRSINLIDLLEKAKLL